MNKRIIHMSKLFLTAVIFLTIGCGKGSRETRSAADVEIDADGRVILSEKAKKEFESAAAEYKAAEKAGWNAENCSSVLRTYERMYKSYGMPDAAFNIGDIHAKCGDYTKARSAFEDVMGKFSEHIPTQQRSIGYLAYLDLLEGNVSAAQQKLSKAVSLGRNTMESVPSYTMAATLLRRAAIDGDSEAWQKSQTALRTALAIDAQYMPALYQLARLYYSIAVSMQRDSYMTLATLVVDQAQKTDPEFAPIYLVLGQIHLERNELVEALRAFETAFQKDPNFYEAYMSFGAINLNFRGYKEAKQAFERAVSIKPNSYDAHMGLGVAARGLGDFARARAEYQKASEIDKSRTDYIFNLGVLEMDYENPGTPDGYRKAKKVFETFVKHATPEHHRSPGRGELSWVEKAKQRIENAEKAALQIEEAERQMAELAKMEAEQKRREAEQEKLAKQAEELAKKEAEGAAAKGSDVDEAAIAKELAEAETQKAEKAKAEAEAKKASEKAKADEAAKKSQEQKKQDVKL